ncbi:hypothetical protein AC579_4953 [Pseudocercospora musae]|uniref:C2H2-type domain-containing protein n=1 Tax=Pseudocercospora musae TaxID=113226 RepID=A0A139I6S2_9PEZI|nr:hypothetical protein AC579_4953 [Pseudocercospora musae]
MEGSTERNAHTAGAASSVTITASASNRNYLPAIDETDSLEPSASEKRPSRTFSDLSILMPARKKSSRSRKIEGGFPCRENCGQCFDRECDQRKHFERRHFSESYWPHEFLYCPKKSQYPKDVCRHLAQTHGKTCCSKPASDWLEEHSLNPPLVQAPSDFQPQPQETRLRHKTKPERYIMVTTDGSQLVEVDVSDVVSTESLAQKVRDTLGVEIDPVNVSFSKWSRRQRSQAMDIQQTLDLVTKAADAEGSTRLLVKITPSCGGGAAAVPTTPVSRAMDAIRVPPSDTAAGPHIEREGIYAHHKPEPSTEGGYDTGPSNLPAQETSEGPKAGLSTLMAHLQRSSSLPPLGARLNLNAADTAIRAKSVPPEPNGTSLNALDRITSRAGTSDGARGSRPASSVSQCRSHGQVRLSNSEGRGTGRNESKKDDDEDIGRRKRPRVIHGTKSVEAKLPCIFFVGTRIFHQKKHAHISELLCLEKFRNEVALKQHGREPCVKACSNANCKRYCAAGSDRSFDCDCITTSEEQWEILFRLQYPDAAVPQVFTSQVSSSPSESTPLSGLDLGVDFDLGELLHFPLPQTNAGPRSAVSHEQIATDTAMASPAVDTHAAAVRQSIQSLGDQLSKAQQDAKNRGLAVELLYGALRRTNSSDAQPGSSILKVIQQLVPDVLKVPDPAVATPSMAQNSSSIGFPHIRRQLGDAAYNLGWSPVDSGTTGRSLPHRSYSNELMSMVQG